MHSVGRVKFWRIRPRKFGNDKFTSLFRVAYHIQCSGDSLSARYLSMHKFCKKIGQSIDKLFVDVSAL